MAEIASLPLFHQITGQIVLVLGDGEAAEPKRRLVERAGGVVIDEIAPTFRPKKRAKMTSGTVDMPTASAPRILSAWISAGVSKDGPEYQA